MSNRRILNSAITAHQQGRLSDAENAYRLVLDAEPNNFTALHLLGVVLHQKGRHEEALEKIDAALVVESASPEALANRGVILLAMGRALDALASLNGSLALESQCADTLSNRGNVFSELKRDADALADYDAALALAPNHSNAWNNRGNLLRRQSRFDEALGCYSRALAISPNFVEAWNNRGTVFRDIKRYDEALHCHQHALRIMPDFAESWNRAGAVLLDLRRPEEALHCFDRALYLNPQYADAWINRGLGFRLLARFADALTCFERAVALQQDLTEAHYCRGITLMDLKRNEDASTAFETVLHLDPKHRYALGGLANVDLQLCKWMGHAAMKTRLEQGLSDGMIVPPLLLLRYFDDPALLQEGARRAVSGLVSPPLWKGEIYTHEKIRLAYLSGDFYEHATAFLSVELFENHDRSMFEVIGVSYGPDDASIMRKRLMKGFDRFLDISNRSDADAARLLHEMNIDILVDLKGHTRDARTQILAERPAPVQVNYLGYPGTMGASFIDYVIGDATVLPRRDQIWYDEAIVHLPDSYQPSGSTYTAPLSFPTRREAGLPETGFVFSCFNNTGKITEPVFDIWTRLLTRVEGSILWLLVDDPVARENLRDATVARGVDPQRLIFASTLAPSAHLARLKLADLFLDTLPYNAHTTASDALRMGVPVITRIGHCFAGRVAASVLKAAGLAELITDDIEGYEALSIRLAQDPDMLGKLREKLASQIATAPLFDADRFRRGLEKAYLHMHAVARSGGAPVGFDVPAGQPTTR